MNIITVVKTSLILFSTALFSIKPVTAAISTPAQMCQPANLSQALALGLGWSQFGITNNSPIGGGSFFVVCPLVLDAVEEPFSTYRMEVQYLAAAAKNITCFINQVDVGNGANMVENAQVVPNASIAHPGAGAYPRGKTATFAPVGFTYTGGDDALSVVCAMHPQTRIGHFGASSM